MTDNTILEYANANGLTPLAWFDINYPAYAVKVKYKYPTSDPADFRNRALLQMIELGVPYRTACSLLMVTDPHEAILERFKSDNPGPQLVHFDKAQNRLALTPIGRQKIEQIELARDGVSCCFIDGFTGEPFPSDVVENLSDRFTCWDINSIPGGIYPFEADIERSISELNAKANDGKVRNYQKRLAIPEGAKEMSMTSLGPKWMKNLSIGIFLKGSDVVRKIFCDDKAKPISPFGWLKDVKSVKLDGNAQGKRFSYLIDKSGDTSMFTKESADLSQTILHAVEKEYGSEFGRQISLEIIPETSQIHIFIHHIDNETLNRSRMLSIIERGIMSIQLNGLTGSLFIKVKASEEINYLGHLRKRIDGLGRDWHDAINMVREKFPDDWRQTLIAIDRHDLLFRYDVEQYIKYGK